MSFLQLAAIVFSFIYIYYASKNDVKCFYAGIVSSALWGLEDFINLNLKFDGFLQVFYLIMSVVGIYQWTDNSNKKKLQLSWFGLKNNVLLIICGIVLTFLLVAFMKSWTTSNSIYLDGGTSVFSVLATFLLVYRIIDTWIYLIVCDVVYLYIYGAQGAWLFVGMMVIYIFMAIGGHYNWKKQFDAANAVRSI